MLVHDGAREKKGVARMEMAAAVRAAARHMSQSLAGASAGRLGCVGGAWS